jgi:Flp pilus assembly protein TadG
VTDLVVVVGLFVIVLYGAITCGLILAAQSTVAHAAADGARSGLISVTTAVDTAEGQAGMDVGWMNKGLCGTSDTTITCVAATIPCPSHPTARCLKVTVTYHYAAAPLFPELPGLTLLTPSVLSSTDVVRLADGASG